MPQTVDLPWAAGAPTGEQVTAAFSVHLDDPMPGAGFFVVHHEDGQESLEGSAFARAARHTVPDATHDVLAVRIHGLPESDLDWSVLEVDVSLDHWVAGDIELGTAGAAGHLTRPDGSVAWLVGGVLRLTHPGVDSGSAVRGELVDVPVWEVAQ